MEKIPYLDPVTDKCHVSSVDIVILNGVVLSCLIIEFFTISNSVRSGRSDKPNSDYMSTLCFCLYQIFIFQSHKITITYKLELLLFL